MSYQGISDEVARNYMADHGAPNWADIARGLETKPDCERLSSFWHFVDCQYRKSEQICAAPSHLQSCPLPKQLLRNGNLNQLAYSCYLFVRDVAKSDLVAGSMLNLRQLTNRILRAVLIVCERGC